MIEKLPLPTWGGSNQHVLVIFFLPRVSMKTECLHALERQHKKCYKEYEKEKTSKVILIDGYKN